MILFRSQKHVFWQALVLTLIVFNIGVFLGYSLEAQRANKINKLYVQSELELIDIKLQNEAFSVINIDCQEALQENINFADKVYEEAKLLLKYEEANRINEAIILQHKKYDLLRTYLWINSIKLKQSCDATYHTVVYIYQYQDPSLDKKAKQRTFSNILGELKQEKGNQIILIPIAGDIGLTSIDLITNAYNITKLPTILIDEKYIITEITTLEDLEKYL